MLLLSRQYAANAAADAEKSLLSLYNLCWKILNDDVAAWLCMCAG